MDKALSVLITGASGYLGGNIAQFLLERGHKVRITDLHTHEQLAEWASQFDLRHADVLQPEQLKGICDGIDVVIHCAAMNEVFCTQEPEKALLINGYGPRNMLAEAVEAGVGRFIYFSTFHVYGKPSTAIISEQTVPCPTHDYAITHRVAEMYCEQFMERHPIRCIVPRFANGYGAALHKAVRRWTLVHNDFCKRAHEEGRIVLKSKGTQKRDFVAMSDIMQAVALFTELPDEKFEHMIYDVGGENPVSIRDVADLVAEVYEKRYGKPLKIEYAPNVLPADIAIDFEFNIDRLKALGYAPEANMHEEVDRIFQLLDQ